MLVWAASQNWKNAALLLVFGLAVVGTDLASLMKISKLSAPIGDKDGVGAIPYSQDPGFWLQLIVFITLLLNLVVAGLSLRRKWRDWSSLLPVKVGIIVLFFGVSVLVLAILPMYAALGPMVGDIVSAVAMLANVALWLSLVIWRNGPLSLTGLGGPAHTE